MRTMQIMGTQRNKNLLRRVLSSSAVFAPPLVRAGFFIFVAMAICLQNIAEAGRLVKMVRET